MRLPSTYTDRRSITPQTLPSTDRWDPSQVDGTGQAGTATESVDAPRDVADSGAAMSSRLRCSASTAKKIATMPATHMIAAPVTNAVTVSETLPLLVRWENSSGPVIPPSAVPTAKKNAIAIARVSIGKI